MSTFSVYFSPTGGTKRVADILAAAYDENYNTIDITENKEVLPSFNKDDTIIISMPVFGGRVPEIALKQIREAVSNGAKAILAAVFGNRAIDDALSELYDVCKEAGFEVIAGIEAVAEHSLARMYGEGRPDDKDRVELISFVDLIKAADRYVPTLPGNRPYKDYKPSAMALSLSESCVNCKLCAKSCPVSAISVENVNILDNEKCFSCMHCVSVCPVKARGITEEAETNFKQRLKERASGRRENKLYI